MPKSNTSLETDRFVDLARKLVQVPKKEVDKRIEEERKAKKEREAKQKHLAKIR